MPYTTKAERERENWMTLPEAVVHIRAAEQCDERAARQQLIKALADGVRVLGPLRWDTAKGDRPPPFGYSPITIPTDTPPIGRGWLEATIRWKTGRVRDDWSEHKNGKWRVLLMLRSKIKQYWSDSPPSGVAAKVPIGKPPGKRRSRPARQLAERALKALYGNLIPDRSGKTDQQLCGEVKAWLDADGNWLKNETKRNVSCDTILRAADRA